MKAKNETYLSDWLAGNITDEQLQQRVSAADFLAFQKIKNAVNEVEISQPDLEQHFNAIRGKLKVPGKPKTKVMPLWRYASVAASLLVLLGGYHFFIAQNSVVTGFGDRQLLTLSDNSTVSLNAKSTLTYNNSYFYKRTLCLEGEAFFEVEKGRPFTVVTGLGEIEVLGTKFNVTAFQDFFEVKCYEGKVKVTQKNKAVVLTPGESVRFYDGKAENWATETGGTPSWMKGESSFRNVPMRYVIEKFKNQYNVAVVFPDRIQDVRFTGTFTHQEMDIALQTICLPLQLKFAKDRSGKIIISE